MLGRARRSRGRRSNGNRAIECSRRAKNCSAGTASIVWHAFTQMAEYEPLMIERAKAARWSTSTAASISTA